ncbi:MAG: LytR/AlgR family response regulator transcription factor [Flavobacteriales bacterium]
MKIRTFIIDDDPFIREELHQELKSQFSDTLEVNGVFDNAVEALGALKNHPPQLVFLDIQMPLMNGFELLDKLGDVPFEVIFITSYNQYAIQAIRYSALDYLLKPIDKNELRKSIERFQSITDKALMQSRLQNLRHNLEAKNEKDFQLIIPTKQGEHQFAASDIIRCEADSNYTVLYLKNKKKFVISRTLSDVCAMLNPETFIRVHKTHLVHLPYIDFLNAEGELVFRDGTHIPVSRRRLAEVKAILVSRKP